MDAVTRLRTLQKDIWVKGGKADLVIMSEVMEHAILYELYRRRVAEYEDGKIKENGDVY